MEFKIALIGDKAVGKTTFLKRLQTGLFEEEYNPTIGYQNHNLVFNSNFGEVRFLVRDCGPGTLSLDGLDGVIIMHDDNNASKYYDNVKALNKNIPIVFCKNNKSNEHNSDIQCSVSVKNETNRNTLALPLLYLLHLMKANNTIRFIDRLDPPKTELKQNNIEFDYLLNLASFCQKVNSSSPNKIFRTGTPKGMFKVTCDFFKNGEIIEQFPEHTFNKIYWAAVPDGIIRIVYIFSINGVYEQTD